MSSESPKQNLLQLLVIALLYYAGARLSLAFAVMQEVIVMLWIPNAIVLGYLLRGTRRRVLIAALAVFAGELAADYGTFTITNRSSSQRSTSARC